LSYQELQADARTCKASVNMPHVCKLLRFQRSRHCCQCHCRLQVDWLHQEDVADWFNNAFLMQLVPLLETAILPNWLTIDLLNRQKHRNG
jgi:hypothetical protein